MKIGIYFEAGKKSGGAYQYALTLLEALKAHPEHSYVAFAVTPDFPFKEYEKLRNWEIVRLAKESAPTTRGTVYTQVPLRRRLAIFFWETLRKLRLYNLELLIGRRIARKRAQLFSAHDVDLMFFHGPSELSFLTDIPAVVPIHDLQHRLQPRFPEVSRDGQYQKREYLYGNIKEKAYRILVDSTVGKEDVMNCYGVHADRIVVTPFLPPSYLERNIPTEEQNRIMSDLSLPDHFFFYPAQFWPHKNHTAIIEAMAILKKRGVRTSVVFCGSPHDPWGALAQTKKIIVENDLTGQVRFLDYVDNHTLSVLYTRAEALVMPTFFGPTNIPPLEAWTLGCPLIYSDLRGTREQAGDAALLIDPADPSTIADAMEKIWRNETLKSELREKGYRRLTTWTQADFFGTIGRIICDFEEARKTQTTNT